MPVATPTKELLQASRLYLVCGARPGGRDPEPVLRAALDGGVDIVQLREKDASDDDVLRAAETFRRVTAEHDVPFILNDRPDLAVRAGADGVHLGQDDMPVAQAREIVGDDLIVGRSTHTPAQVDAANAEAIDYFASGPVHATPTKPGRPAVGPRAGAPRGGRARAIPGSPSAGSMRRRSARRWTPAPAASSWCARSPRPRTRAPRPATCDRSSRRPVGRRSRKRRAPGAPRPAPVAATPSRASRTEQRNAEVRAQLEPLAPGERPLPVTIAAIVAVVVAVANVIAYAAGAEVNGKHTGVGSLIVFVAIMLVAAWGMWNRRYWAVLGFQALLAITLIIVALALIVASNLARGDPLRRDPHLGRLALLEAHPRDGAPADARTARKLRVL